MRSHRALSMQVAQLWQRQLGCWLVRFLARSSVYMFYSFPIQLALVFTKQE
jgi:hypothetical protein